MIQWLKETLDITEINHFSREVHYIFGTDFLFNFYTENF